MRIPEPYKNVYELVCFFPVNLLGCQFNSHFQTKKSKTVNV